MSDSNNGFEVCEGALCKCQFGKAPGKLKVLSQRKHYINDPNGAQKLMATDKETGQPFEPPFFGSCSKKNNSPCAVNITEWSGFYDKVTIETGGHPLVDSSKATCPTGTKDCISITWHGQTAVPVMASADMNVVNAINPLAVIK